MSPASPDQEKAKDMDPLDGGSAPRGDSPRVFRTSSQGRKPATRLADIGRSVSDGTYRVQSDLVAEAILARLNLQ